jgi:hypothetical protein
LVLLSVARCETRRRQPSRQRQILQSRSLPPKHFHLISTPTEAFSPVHFEGGGVYRSPDDGDNWTLVDNGLTNTYVTALAINSGGHVFAATFGGGAQWKTFNIFLGF